MRKLYILSLLTIMIAWGIAGCGGGGGGTSGDPLGTDSLIFGHKNNPDGTDWSMSMQVNPKGTAVLTAKIKNASGKAIVGREVSFGFKANQSAATLNASSVTTDAAGEAVVIYTAGTVSGFDVVHASISNGAQMDTNITVGGTGSNAADYISSISPSLLTVSGGQMSIIKTTVRHEGVIGEISEQTITFTIPANNSGASFIDSSGASVSTIKISMQLEWNTFTEISVTYKAGKNVSGTNVEDMVQAVLGNGSTTSIIITRGGTTAETSADYVSSISPSLSKVSGGQMSIIKTTVRHEGVYGEKAEQTITFTIPVNNSGASFIDSSGASVSTIRISMQLEYNTFTEISITYKAGTNASETQVEDMVQATLGNGSTTSILITRTASSSTSAFSITVGASPTILASKGANSVITANVKNNLGIAVAGVKVDFAVVGVNPLGTLSVPSAITDGMGNAVTIFQGNGVGATGATSVVTVSITVSGNTYTNAAIITYP